MQKGGNKWWKHKHYSSRKKGGRGVNGKGGRGGLWEGRKGAATRGKILNHYWCALDAHSRALLTPTDGGHLWSTPLVFTWTKWDERKMDQVEGGVGERLTQETRGYNCEERGVHRQGTKILEEKRERFIRDGTEQKSWAWETRGKRIIQYEKYCKKKPETERERTRDAIERYF